MKRILVALALLALPCLSQAAPPDSTSSARANSLHAGAWALQFAITDFLDVNEFAGGVSFKWHLSPKSALRFGVEGGASSADTELPNPTATSENDGFNVAVSPLYQRYINPGTDANFYWGAGPLFRFSTFSQEQHVDSTSARRDEDSYSIGVAAVVGAEWFATQVISFHAEYIGTAEYQNRTTDESVERVGFPPDTRHTEQSSWFVGANGAVRFGLSIYF